MCNQFLVLIPLGVEKADELVEGIVYQMDYCPPFIDVPLSKDKRSAKRNELNFYN